jgi:DNA-binding HxlR family transcriptional regulator
MPRWTKDAKSQIYACLFNGPKTWGDLLKETKLSNAHISRTIKKLIEDNIVSTKIDTTKRPSVTIYHLDKKKALEDMTETKNVLAQKEPESAPLFIPYQELGKFAQKQPGKLRYIVRLAIMQVLTGRKLVSITLSSSEDVDMESFSLAKAQSAITAKEAETLCMKELMAMICRAIKWYYGIEVPEKLVEQETSKLLEEGFFDIGPKNIYGVRVKQKLAEYYKNDGQNLNEIETLDLNTIKQIEMGVSWIDDFFRLLNEANLLEKGNH